MPIWERTIVQDLGRTCITSRWKVVIYILLYKLIQMDSIFSLNSSCIYLSISNIGFIHHYYRLVFSQLLYLAGAFNPFICLWLQVSHVEVISFGATGLKILASVGLQVGACPRTLLLIILNHKWSREMVRIWLFVSRYP